MRMDKFLDITIDWLCEHCHLDDVVLTEDDDDEYVVECRDCGHQFKNWHISYNEEMGCLEVIFKPLEDPVEVEKIKERERQRREAYLREKKKRNREAKNPLWVVVEMGYKTEKCPVYATKEEAVAEYKHLVAHAEKGKKVYPDKKVTPINNPGDHIVGESFDVNLHEGVTITTKNYELTLGYGKFVISKRTEDGKTLPLEDETFSRTETATQP
jgi:hypothetical protein